MPKIDNLAYYRQRALDLLRENTSQDTFESIDREIDKYLRRSLKLPDRPHGSMPYVGWITPPKPPSSSGKRTSAEGIDLIKSHEGLRLNAYLCPAGVLTIGYGHTATVYPNMAITTSQAETLLTEDLRKFEDAVSKYVTVPISQNQFDALVSFSFNVGVGAFRGSTLLRLLNNKRYRQAANEFDRWVNGGGVRLPGLVRRRREEKELFLS